MKKLLIILCTVLSYAASNGSVVVDVPESDFDRILAVYTYVATANQPIAIIEKSQQGAQRRQYLFYKDGFYYRTGHHGKKEFSSNTITVVPAQSVSEQEVGLIL